MSSIKYIGGWNSDNLGDNFIKAGFIKLFRPLVVSNTLKQPSLVALVGGTVSPGWVLQFYKDVEAGIPAFIFGTGIVESYATFKNGIVKTALFSDTNDYWQSIFSKALYIGVRTQGAANILKSLGAGRVEVIGDPAISCCFPKVRNVNSRKIGISLHTNWKCYGNQESVDRVMASVIKDLLNSGFNVEFFPCEHISDTNSDIIHNMNFIKHYGLRGVSIHRNYHDINRTIHKISQCKFIIGERLHPVILAFASGVPVISLAYHDKCIDFMNSVDLAKFAIRTDDLSNDKLSTLIHDINMNYQHYSKKLVEISLMYQKLQVDRSEEIKRKYA